MDEPNSTLQLLNRKGMAANPRIPKVAKGSEKHLESISKVSRYGLIISKRGCRNTLNTFVVFIVPLRLAPLSGYLKDYLFGGVSE